VMIFRYLIYYNQYFRENKIFEKLWANFLGIYLIKNFKIQFGFKFTIFDAAYFLVRYKLLLIS